MGDSWVQWVRLQRGGAHRPLTFVFGLSALLCSARTAAAQSEQVRVLCPQLSDEQAAEVEARVRASLLTKQTLATVDVSCDDENASVRIESNGGASALETLPASANLREELLGALDRAFAKLDQAAPIPPPAPLPEPPPAEPEPVFVPAPVPRAPDRPTLAWLRSFSMPLSAHAMGELWSSQLAWGGALGSEWARGPLRYGARGAVLFPLAKEASFDATEWHGALHVAAQPAALGGIQVALGLGMGWMVVSPQAEAVSRERRVVSAPFVTVALSRALRVGRLAVVPELGVRAFTAERGVRVDEEERLAFGWLVPRLALGLAYVSN